MVHAVAEEQPFCIDRELAEFFAFPVPIIPVQNILHKMPDGKVVPVILHPDDVPAVFGCLAEMIDILFLLQTETVPSGNPVPHYLDIGKFIDQISETVLLRGSVSASRHRNGRTARNQHIQRFHIYDFKIPIMPSHPPDTVPENPYPRHVFVFPGTIRCQR